MKNKLILAIVGMCGSGKSEVVKYLKEKNNWPSVYLGEITFDRLREENLAVNEKNERYMREKIRAEHGMGAYAILSLPKIEKLLENNNTVIVESLYSWSEYKILKEKFSDDFKVLAVTASPAVRYARLKNRAERQMSEEQSCVRDYSEIENIEKGGPIAIADYTVVNESNFQDLQEKLNSVI
jgi:dephospho-CoA kinase